MSNFSGANPLRFCGLYVTCLMQLLILPTSLFSLHVVFKWSHWTNMASSALAVIKAEWNPFAPLANVGSRPCTFTAKSYKLQTTEPKIDVKLVESLMVRFLPTTSKGYLSLSAAILSSLPPPIVNSCSWCHVTLRFGRLGRSGVSCLQSIHIILFLCKVAGHLTAVMFGGQMFAIILFLSCSVVNYSMSSCRSSIWLWSTLPHNLASGHCCVCTFYNKMFFYNKNLTVKAIYTFLAELVHRDLQTWKIVRPPVQPNHNQKLHFTTVLYID